TGTIIISRKLAPRILPTAISAANLKLLIETTSSGSEVARARKTVPTRASFQFIAITIPSPILASHTPRKTMTIKQRENKVMAELRRIPGYVEDGFRGSFSSNLIFLSWPKMSFNPIA
ncbi:unnamed protein product, partial [marine sediment metagenome]